MTINVILSPEAEADIASIAAYYGTLSPQAVENFYLELQSVRKRLQTFPLSSPVYSNNIRRMTLFSLPYHLYYSCSTDMVSVLTILPQKFGLQNIHTRILH